MADINVDVNLPSVISVDITSPTQALATNISIPGSQGPRGEKGNPTSINSLTAENIIITGADGNIVYTTGLNAIFVSGNSGYFQSAINSLTTNLNNTGANLNTSINSLSGLFTGYTGSLDATYATDSQLNSTGSNLENKINSLSGTLTGNYLTINSASSTYATINNLNSTGSTLNSSISSLSGTLTSNYATISNLNLTGSTLQSNINTATSNLITTGNTLQSNINTLSSNLISTGNTLEGKISSLSGTLTSNYATITNLASTGATLTSSINSLNSSFTGFTGNLDLTYATDTQLQNTGSTLSQNINSLSGTLTGNYYLKSNPSGFITGVDLSSYITSSTASSTYATITNLISTGSTLVNSINSLSGTLTGNYATITNLNSTGNTLNSSITSLSGTITGNYVTKSNGQFTNRPTVSGSGIALRNDGILTKGGFESFEINSNGGLQGYFQAKTTNGVDGNIGITIYEVDEVTVSGYSLLGVRNGDGFLQSKSSDFRIETYGGGLGNLNAAGATFDNRPTVNGTGVLLIGEAANLPETIVYTTGDQTISGIKDFVSRPTVNGTGILLSGEIPNLPTTIVYTTGNQTISGNKNFVQNVIVGDQTQDDLLVVSGNEISFGVIPTVSGNPLLTGIDLSSYATVANLASTGSTLTTSINSLSGTLTGNYATILNLASTGSTLQTNINNLSGYINSSSSNIVFTTGDQTISGNKTFANDLSIRNNLFFLTTPSGYISGSNYDGNYNGGIYIGRTRLNQSTLGLIENSFGTKWSPSAGSAGSSSRNWKKINVSDQGKYQVGIVSGGTIYVSDNYGASWPSKTSIVGASNNWSDVAISSDGKYLIACADGGYVWLSNGYGTNWAQSNILGTGNWKCVSLSSSAQYQIAISQDSATIAGLWMSKDYGNSWIYSGITGKNPSSATMSSDGKYQRIALYSNENSLYSNDYGNTWKSTAQQTTGCLHTRISSDGSYQLLSTDEYIKISKDYGTTWVDKFRIPTPANKIKDLTISANAHFQAIALENNYIYTSYNYGESGTWNQVGLSGNWSTIDVNSNGKLLTAAMSGATSGFVFVSNTDEQIRGDLYADNISAYNNIKANILELNSINNSNYFDQPKIIFGNAGLLKGTGPQASLEYRAISLGANITDSGNGADIKKVYNGTASPTLQLAAGPADYSSRNGMYFTNNISSSSINQYNNFMFIDMETGSSTYGAIRIGNFAATDRNTPSTEVGYALQVDGNIKAANLVYISGNQNISGVKTFTTEVTAPNLVYNTGNQTISGNKTFNNNLNILTNNTITEFSKLEITAIQKTAGTAFPVNITTNSSHNYQSGDLVTIEGLKSQTCVDSALNGTYSITEITSLNSFRYLPNLNTALSNLYAVGCGYPNATAKVNSSKASFANLNCISNRININNSKTPASGTDIGTKGEICWDLNYIYVCVNNNTWKRVALTSW